MKKFMFIISLFMISPLVFKAECTYKDLRELNTFAAYVETSYKYNEETKLMDLTVTNLGNKAYIKDEYGGYFAPEDGTAFIDKLYLGQTYKISVMASQDTNCPNENLRVIYVRIPYKNPYYNNTGCVGHENLSVCNSRFLDYQISWETFLSLLKKDSENSNIKEPDEEPVKELTFMEKVVEFVSEIYIKVIVVTVTLIITISIYSVILRKVKHGF